MPAATITIVEQTDPSVTFTGAGWSTDGSSSNSGGSAQKTTGSGDTCTFVTPIACRSIYLMHAVLNSGAIYGVSVDGVNQQGQFSIYSGNQSTGGFYRVLTPLYRSGVGADAVHTVVLTNPAGGNTLWVDGFVLVSGAKGTPLPGVYVAMGDSWTTGTGAVNVRGAYAPKAAAILQARLKRPIQLVNLGLAGDELWGQTSVKTGALYRTIAALANQPEFLSYLFGANDLSNQQATVPAGEFGKNINSLCCLLEDALDTSLINPTDASHTKVAIATPPWLGPGVLANSALVATPTLASLTDNLETAAALTRATLAAFPWVSMADVFSAMDYRSSLMVPNNAGDFGLHPNDTGHGVIAGEIARALLSVVS